MKTNTKIASKSITPAITPDDAVRAKLDGYRSTDVDAGTLATLRVALVAVSSAARLIDTAARTVATLKQFTESADYRNAFKAWREMSALLGYSEQYSRQTWSKVGGSKLNPEYKPRETPRNPAGRAGKSGSGKVSAQTTRKAAAASGLTLSKDETRLIAMMRDTASLRDAIIDHVDAMLARRDAKKAHAA